MSFYRWVPFFALVFTSPSFVSSTFAYLDSDYASVQNAKEKKIESLRNEEITAIRTALGLRSPENRKAELYMRLSELYLEAYQADFLLEGRLHEKELTRNPKAKFQKSRTTKDLQSGVGFAEQILELKIEHKKLDQVYYFLGYNYSELGNKQRALSYYRKLSEEYPDSSFAPEAYRAIADDAFANAKYEDAEKMYQRALQKAKAPSQQARIYHKLAWCYYREKRPDQAIDAMKRAIAIAQQDKEKSLSVSEEGLRDIAIFYAETGRVDEAIQYFKQNSGGNEKLVSTLERLGKEYERSGQAEKAIMVYEAMVKIPTQDQSSLRATIKLTQIDILKQNYMRGADRIELLKLPSEPDTDTNIAIQNLKQTIRNVAITHQERYRKASDKEEAKKLLYVSDRYYSLYLRVFLTQKNAPKEEKNEIKMYWAEVKRDLDKPGDAALLYKQIIADQDPKYAKDAAQLWVSSLANELKKQSKNNDASKEAPSQIERDFVEASDLLEKTISDSVESREARLRAAQILAAYPAEKANAILRAKKLSQDAPSTPQGVLAARLWLQLQPTVETTQGIRGNQALLDQDAKQKKELLSDLVLVERKLKVENIAVLEKGKNYSSAGKEYEEYAAQSKDQKEAEKAYLGAMNAYAQSGSSEDVLRVMRAWKSRYPKSSEPLNAVKNQATLFFIKGLYSDSAELFLVIGRQFSDFESVLTAASLFEGSLQYPKATETYKTALSMTRATEAQAKIYRDLALLAVDSKDDLASFEAWKSCYALNSSYKAECGSQVGNSYLRLSDFQPAKNTFTQVVGIKSGPSAKSPYIAYAQFRLAQILEREMKSPALEFPEERLIQAFQSRVTELKPVTDAYQKAVSLGGPWGFAAAERIGELSLVLSGEVNQILKSPKASDQIKQALNPVVDALRKKAVDNYKSSYEIALKQQVLSPALPVIHDRLVDAQYGGFNRAQGARSGIRLVGIAADGGSLGNVEAMRVAREKLEKKTDDALGWIDYGNLLWGEGKPGLSKVAYQRALELKTRTADALNNIAVVLVSDMGYENWVAVNEAVATWKQALSKDPQHVAALFNLGHYFNYFRLFKLAKPYLEKLASKISIAEVHDALGVSSWAMNQKAESDLQFSKAEELGIKKNRFSKKYIESAQASSAKDCLRRLDEIQSSGLKGFEKVSFDLQKTRCSE